MTKNKNTIIYQFKITLAEIKPAIWRRIQVPSKYSFWDLHVAIQDAMGWLDYHLHAFRFKPKHRRKPIEIGIPSDEWEGEEVIPGWTVPITEYFTEPGQTMEYLYDFGDSWHHEILLEAILIKEKDLQYPRCLGGERACPPEDCGSTTGYYKLLKIIRNPKHSEHEEYKTWLKGHAKNYHPYDPEKFNPEEVHFDNPKQRWKEAFTQTEKD